MNKTFIAIAIVLIIGVGIFLFTRPQSSSQTPSTYEASSIGTPPAQVEGEILAGKSSLLYDFSKAKYDEAIKSAKLIVLYFYADWCPICKEEVPKMYDAFNELTTDQVIGIRVNFNDSETDSDEQNLAREYGVAYQHTKVFVKNGTRILKSPETWEKQRYLDEIQKAI